MEEIKTEVNTNTTEVKLYEFDKYILKIRTIFNNNTRKELLGTIYKKPMNDKDKPVGSIWIGGCTGLGLNTAFKEECLDFTLIKDLREITDQYLNEIFNKEKNN